MAPLHTLNLGILTKDVLLFFERNGIVSVEDFLIQNIYSLVAVAENDVNGYVLRQAIAEILLALEVKHRQWMTGSEMLEYFHSCTHVLLTGCEGLDSLLGGGLFQGTVTELVGPSASGKTQVCLFATSHIAYKYEAAVIYIDSSNSFSPKRIAHFLNVQENSLSKKGIQQSDLEIVMKRIQHLNVYDIFCLLHVLNEVEARLKIEGNKDSRRVCLLVVDSISSILTPVSGSGLQGNSLMISVGFLLKKLAIDHNIAVLTTNGLVVGEAGMTKPALGESWKTVPHVQIQLSKDRYNSIYEAILLRHTSMAWSTNRNFFGGHLRNLLLIESKNCSQTSLMPFAQER